MGRFRKEVDFDQSKGIGGLARPRRSWIGCRFGRPRCRGGEIDKNGVLNFGGPTVKFPKIIETHTQPSHFVAIDAFSTTDGLPPLSLLPCTPPVLVLVAA